MNTITIIYFSKTKLIKLVLISAVAAGSGLWFLIAQPQIDVYLLNDTIVKNTLGVLCTALGLFGFISFTIKMFTKKPAIVITNDGIQDNSSVLAVGFLPWSAIASIAATEIQVSAFSKQTFISISVKNPDEFLQKQRNPFARKIMQLNSNHYQSLISISCNGVQNSFEEVYQSITSYFDAYQLQHRDAEMNQLLQQEL
jgi:hypothetical protein